MVETFAIIDFNFHRYNLQSMQTMKIRHLLQLLTVILLSANSYADWRVVPGSTLSFQTTKNTDTSDIHKINYITGFIKSSGIIDIDVHLSSLKTSIPTRDARLKTTLFEVVDYPTAKFEGAMLDQMILDRISAGRPVNFSVNGNLHLHGVALPITLNLMALFSETTGYLMVTTAEPIIISAKSFGLEKGIELLRQVASLDSIGTSVPVSFTITLQSVE